MASFFKTVGDKVIFTGDGELIYYIPEKYFEIKAAEIMGERVTLLGLGTYAVFDKSGKRIMFKPIKCETMIQCIPSSITKESNYLLEGTKEPKAYRLLHFKNGDELMCSTKVPVDTAVLEKFVDIYKGGNLPENIPYNKIQDYIFKNAELCKFDYKISNQALGIGISEIYRDEEDLSRPFRLAKTNNMLKYKAISVDKIPKYTSEFAAVTSDNADEAIAAAMTIKNHKDSPLEKIVMA